MMRRLNPISVAWKIHFASSRLWALAFALVACVSCSRPPRSAIDPSHWSNLGSGCTRSVVSGPEGAQALEVVSDTSSGNNTCGYQTAVSGDYTARLTVFAAVSNGANGSPGYDG